MGTSLRLAAFFRGCRSRYWTFRTTATKPGVYISREGLPTGAKVSLHADREWHLTANGRDYSLAVTDPVHPSGTRHAVTVMIAKSACTLADGSSKPELLVLPDDDSPAALLLELFLTPEGSTIATQTESGRETPRWDMEMPSGHAVRLFARLARVDDIEISIDAPPGALERIRDGVAAGTADQMIVVGGGDRPITIVDAAMHPS